MTLTTPVLPTAKLDAPWALAFDTLRRSEP